MGLKKKKVELQNIQKEKMQVVIKRAKMAEEGEKPTKSDPLVQLGCAVKNILCLGQWVAFCKICSPHYPRLCCGRIGRDDKFHQKRTKMISAYKKFNLKCPMG